MAVRQRSIIMDGVVCLIPFCIVGSVLQITMTMADPHSALNIMARGYKIRDGNCVGVMIT